MATAAGRLPDWEVGPIVYPWTKKAALLGVLAGPIVALLLAPVLLPGTAWDLGAFGASLLLTAFWVASYRRVVAREVRRGLAVAPLQHARFENLVRGLAADSALTVPQLFVIEDGGPNALVVGGRRPLIAVTRSLLETYTRTEQEAVVAHCLLRLASDRLLFERLAAMLGRSGSRFAPRVGFEDDVHAAALTRYPPGLAAAISKAKPAEGPGAGLWFAAHDPSHRHPIERAAALQDL